MRSLRWLKTQERHHSHHQLLVRDTQVPILHANIRPSENTRRRTDVLDRANLKALNDNTICIKATAPGNKHEPDCLTAVCNTGRGTRRAAGADHGHRARGKTEAKPASPPNCSQPEGGGHGAGARPHMRAPHTPRGEATRLREPPGANAFTPTPRWWGAKGLHHPGAATNRDCLAAVC